jgi:hypothetical protein
MDTKKYDAEKYEFLSRMQRKPAAEDYAVLTLIIGVLFELLVYYMHVSSPTV